MISRMNWPFTLLTALLLVPLPALPWMGHSVSGRFAALFREAMQCGGDGSHQLDLQAGPL